MQTRSWEQDGVKKYRTEVVAEVVQFGPRKSNDEQESPSDDQSQAPTDNVNPDDIPF